MASKIVQTGLTALILLLAGQVFANEFIISNKRGQSVIEGTISKRFFDTVVLELDNGSEINVDIDNLDMDEDLFMNYFQKGERIQVVGNFQDDEFNAEHIIKDPDNANVVIVPDLD